MKKTGRELIVAKLGLKGPRGWKWGVGRWGKNVGRWKILFLYMAPSFSKY